MGLYSLLSRSIYSYNCAVQYIYIIKTNQITLLNLDFCFLNVVHVHMYLYHNHAYVIIKPQLNLSKCKRSRMHDGCTMAHPMCTPLALRSTCLSHIGCGYIYTYISIYQANYLPMLLHVRIIVVLRRPHRLAYISRTSSLKCGIKVFFITSVLITDLFIASPGGSKCTSTYGSGKPTYVLHNTLHIAITYT